MRAFCIGLLAPAAARHAVFRCKPADSSRKPDSGISKHLWTSSNATHSGLTHDTRHRDLIPEAPQPNDPAYFVETSRTRGGAYFAAP